MSHDHVYQARLIPPAGTGHPDGDTNTRFWEVDVLGVGVTQAAALEECAAMAVDLVAILHPELEREDIRVEFVR